MFCLAYFLEKDRSLARSLSLFPIWQQLAVGREQLSPLDEAWALQPATGLPFPLPESLMCGNCLAPESVCFYSPALSSLFAVICVLEPFFPCFCTSYVAFNLP